MTEIIEHQAQSITIQTDETFDQFADRIYTKCRYPIQYKSGERIELDPALAYTFLMLGMPRLLTPEEFAGLLPYVMPAIAQAEADGTIPPGLIRTIATPFDVPPRPAIPAKFADDIGEGVEIKTYLAGETAFLITKKHTEPEIEE